jgi:hypothetical protein
MPAGHFPGQQGNTPVRVFQKGFEGFNPVFHQQGVAVGDLVDIPDKPVNFVVEFNQDTFPAGTALQIGETKEKGKPAQDKGGGGKDQGNGHGFILLTTDVYVFTQVRVPDYRRLPSVPGFGGAFFARLTARSVSSALPPGVPVLDPLRSIAGILKFGYGMRPFFGLF